MEIDRNNILSILDSFIEQIDKIRKFLIGVSISSLILAPIAISLVVFLFTHPSFFRILEAESEFGSRLIFFISAVLIVSIILFIVGILQYKQISTWHKKYLLYKKERDEVDRYISSKLKFEPDKNEDQTE
jgi:MFS family permease